MSKQQHAIAENRPGFDGYNESKPTVALEKQDAVGLYATTQHLKLPYGDYHDYSQAEIDTFDANHAKWGSLPESPEDIDKPDRWQTDIGCQIEADWVIPQHLHDKFNELPPLPVGGYLTVCVPLVSILGSMSMRAWPISQAKENIRIVIKLADVLNYGKWSATPVGSCVIDSFKMWISYIRISPDVERKMVIDHGGIITVPTVDFVQTSTSVVCVW